MQPSRDPAAAGQPAITTVFLSGDANPLSLCPDDRRFAVCKLDPKDPLAGVLARLCTPLTPNQQLLASLKQHGITPASSDDLGERFMQWLSRPLTEAPKATEPAPHPSRTAPKCCDCRHYVVVRGIKEACNHPAQRVNLDDGQPVVSPYRARTDEASCKTRGDFFCGPSGLGFGPRIG